MNSQVKRYIRGGEEGSENKSFCPCGAGVCHPPGVDVFANLEALWTLYFWDFMEASTHWYDQLSTQFPAPLPPSGEWGMGLKFPSF